MGLHNPLCEGEWEAHLNGPGREKQKAGAIDGSTPPFHGSQGAQPKDSREQQTPAEELRALTLFANNFRQHAVKKSLWWTF